MAYQDCNSGYKGELNVPLFFFRNLYLLYYEERNMEIFEALRAKARRGSLHGR